MWKWGGKVLGSDGCKTRALDTHGHCQLQRAGEQGVRGALCLSVSTCQSSRPHPVSPSTVRPLHGGPLSVKHQFPLPPQGVVP